MKRFIFSAFVTLVIFNGVLFSSLCSAAYPGSWGYYNRPVRNAQTRQATPATSAQPVQNVQTNQEKPANSANHNYPPRWRPMTLTEMQTGYTIEQILSMPITERPDRPGHFIGNTIRWQYRNQQNQQNK